MDYKNLPTPDQPFPLRVAIHLMKFAASLKLAVILIFSSAFFLAWATFVESEFGADAVQYGVYQSSLFSLLLFGLAVNIFFAAAIRYPWKRHQTGFVVTHIGLLVLLFGCYLQRRGGIDAQMPILEGNTNYRAYTDELYFKLVEFKTTSNSDATSKEIEIPFQPGPFTWSRFDEIFAPTPQQDETLGWHNRLADFVSIGFKNAFRFSSKIAFSLASPDRDTIFDQDGIQLEVLDFYANSVLLEAPRVRLMLSMPTRTEIGEDGKQHTTPTVWVPISLGIPAQKLVDFPHGIGDSRTMGGGKVTFRLAGSDAERDAFLQALPSEKIGPAGQVVLWAEGKPYRIDVQEFLKLAKDDKPSPLGDTGLSAKLVHYLPDSTLRGDDANKSLTLVEKTAPNDLISGPGIEIDIFRGQQKLDRLVLFAKAPESSIQATKANVFGQFWVDFGELKAEDRIAGKSGARIDIVLDQQGKLFYRYWNGKEIVFAEELPQDGTRVNAFKMPAGQLQMYVDQLYEAQTPGKKFFPAAHNKDKRSFERRQAVHLRMTVDGKEKEFWLVSTEVLPYDERPRPEERKFAVGEGRTILITLEHRDCLRDENFEVRLNNFTRRLDPGTNSPSHYGSDFDILPRNQEKKGADEQNPASLKPLVENVSILMNVPYDYVDPQSGRTYRFFQESFGGPWGPNEPLYQRFVKDPDRQDLYMSVLTVNYDPGRGVRSLGCLLIVLGIFLMFYMRAYFLKPKQHQTDVSGQ